jgi:hypothetical protein
MGVLLPGDGVYSDDCPDAVYGVPRQRTIGKNQDQPRMHVAKISHYLWQAVQITLSQLVIILGPGLALALVMHLLADFIARKACLLIGRSAFLTLFGWLGTIVHEGGHVLFCVLFGHRITAIKWFDPGGADGTLGYVRHRYDPDSSFQRIGQFFIGIGPILLGTTVICCASRYLLGAEIFASLRHHADTSLLTAQFSFAALAQSIGHGLSALFPLIFSASNLTDWKFYLFLYLTFAVGSAISLSPQDVTGAASGFFALAGLLLAFNVVTGWLGSVPESVFRGVSSACSIFYAAMVLAVFMNALIALVLLLLPASPGKSR